MVGHGGKIGESSTDGQKESWRDFRGKLHTWSDDDIRRWVAQKRIMPVYAESEIAQRNLSDECFEKELNQWFPEGKIYRYPGYWEDTRFNNPSQPMVGVTWYEARAYCNWLTANVGGDRVYCLPSETEFEAAARGREGRMFPYGNEFDVGRSNTFESHIRRTTPVGIYANATPEGAFDLSGNVYIWTVSIYDQEKFPYPYKSDDGREAIKKKGARRVVRGGSWDYRCAFARAIYRRGYHPADRDDLVGFRVVCMARPT
jgi:formylglycine-generating enzyme required for sulfatase activity